MRPQLALVLALGFVVWLSLALGGVLVALRLAAGILERLGGA